MVTTALDIHTFVDHYVTAMLWSSTGDDGEPLDDNYTMSDLSSEAIEQCYDDCARFIQMVGEYITDENYIGSRPSCYPIEAYAAHDFWLTRCGHGAGFWDGDWKSDDLPASTDGPLTEAAHSFGNVDPLIWDDGLIHLA